MKNGAGENRHDRVPLRQERVRRRREGGGRRGRGMRRGGRRRRRRTTVITSCSFKTAEGKDTQQEGEVVWGQGVRRSV